MFDDFSKFLSALNNQDVRYLISGSCAVSFHAPAAPRVPRDIDVLIKAEPDSNNAIQAALAELGIRRRKWPPMYFIKLGTFFRIENPVRADIRPICDVEFDNAWKKRIPAIINPASGLAANFISLEDLIASKLAAGRTKDLADVDTLYQAASRPWMRFELPSAVATP